MTHEEYDLDKWSVSVEWTADQSINALGTFAMCCDVGGTIPIKERILDVRSLSRFMPLPSDSVGAVLMASYVSETDRS